MLVVDSMAKCRAGKRIVLLGLAVEYVGRGIERENENLQCEKQPETDPVVEEPD